MNKTHVLILDQGRQCLPFLRSLKENDYYVSLVCISKISEGRFSRYPDEKLFWPNYNTNNEDFRLHLLEYLRKRRPDVTLALGDVAAEILSRNKAEVSKYTNVTSPDYNIYEQTTDKLKLMQFCMEYNIPCPKTFELSDSSDLNEITTHLNFPVIVKPRKGIGALGVTRISSLEELKAKVSDLHKNFGELLIQEYIPFEYGEQYQAEFFLNEKQDVCAGVVISKPRFFPVYGGTSTANVSVKNDKIYSVGKDLLQKLKWKGAADIDFILDKRTGIPKVIEINPRVTAGIKVAFMAGVDFAELHVRLAKSQKIKKNVEYITDVYCRNLFLELLWWIFSTKKMKKETKPSFYNFFGKKVCFQTFSWDDPLTGFGFLLNMVQKYSSLKKLKEKFQID